jgi:ATP-dependent helicase HepA
MLAAAETEARRVAAAEIGAALAAAGQALGAERDRLAALAKINPSVRNEEVEALDAELEALRHAIPTASPRLDAVRFVCTPDIAGH